MNKQYMDNCTLAICVSVCCMYAYAIRYKLTGRTVGALNTIGEHSYFLFMAQ